MKAPKMMTEAENNPTAPSAVDHGPFIILPNDRLDFMNSPILPNCTNIEEPKNPNIVRNSPPTKPNTPAMNDRTSAITGLSTESVISILLVFNALASLINCSKTDYAN